MRIATAYRYDESVDSLQRRQRDLSEVQASMTNGKRINKPSDDPTGAARAERAFLAQQRITANQRLVDASRSALTLGEATVGHAADLLQDARETIVVAGNGSYGAGERAAQVDHLKNLRSQLMVLANQDDGGGGYVFGGQSGHTLPFVDTPQGVKSLATPGQQQLSASEAMPTTLDGGAVWLQASTGNGVFVVDPAAGNAGQGWVTPGAVTDPSVPKGTDYDIVFSVSAGVTTYEIFRDGNPSGVAGEPYLPSRDIAIDGMTLSVGGQPADGDRFELRPSTSDLNPFAALDRAIAVLSDTNAKPGQVAQAVNSGMRDMDALLTHFQAARSYVGATLNRLDSVDSRNQDRVLWAKSVQADAEDVDMVQAVSEFQNKQTGYQAALQSYALVQRMSLFDYIK